MATEERELTSPVDLATPDGRRLNPEAVGWSRTPLHTANLRGVWGRNKKWDYWAILAGDLVVSVTYGDVDYVGLASVWWADLSTGLSGGVAPLVIGASGLSLPDLPGSEPLRASKSGLAIEIADDPAGNTSILATWTEADGTSGRLDAVVALPAGHESLNVVIPWSETRFQYTSKHQARPTSGTFTLGDRTVDLDGAWGVLDVGRGRWPYSTQWNWGGGAGAAADGATVGIQVGGKWTKGTGHTENGLIVDGRISKIGRELDWDYDWEDPMRPWSVVDPGGQLDLRLEPRFDRYDKTDLLAIRTEVHQVFGTWSGWVRDDDGRRVELEGIQGFAEESRSRW